MTHRILLVDNDELSRTNVKLTLQGGGYHLNETGEMDEAFAIVSDARIDLVLLIWGSPTNHHIQFIKRLKSDEKTKKSCLILLAGSDVDDETVRGLKAGADDYITKPFSAKTLMIRINAWLNGGEEESAREKIIRFDALCLDEDSHTATVSSKFIPLAPTEFRLLNFFMRHPNKAFRREELIANIWDDSDVDRRTIDVHIRRLRKALTPYDYDGYIQTVRTIGYRFSNHHRISMR